MQEFGGFFCTPGASQRSQVMLKRRLHLAPLGFDCLLDETSYDRFMIEAAHA